MIPDKLRLIRQTKGYSQEELARQLQVSFPTVNSWERGRVPHTPGKQHAIDMLYRAVVRAGDRNQVFIVDDDEAAGLVLADYAELALPDWKAAVIDNGYDAILQIGLQQPRIVLLDIMMLQIDGIEVLARIRHNADLADVQVIFTTATTEEGLLDRARAAGALALLHKPVERQELTDFLRAAVRTTL
ncbi:MAG TPA: hypothetical protein DIT01_02355 [Lentisphaeria bacterium]|nr:hypothetical protein [Lentisphaeria bacterium]